MVELVHVRAVIQLVGGKAVSCEVTEEPVCDLSRDELLHALRVGPANFMPQSMRNQMPEQVACENYRH